MNLRKRILIAPLNWGLGHATRCIPIIHALIEHKFEPVIASDGESFKLLKKEFPELKFVELPSYNIKYSKKGEHLRIKLLKNWISIKKAINAEHQIVSELIKGNEIDGIISDNRFGVYSKQIPSVYMTHQLNVLSGRTSWFSSIIHQQLIKKFDECWVPDFENTPNLSGALGHMTKPLKSVKYLGPISRFSKQESVKIYDLLVLLSGPEPQRSLLEAQLLDQLINYEGKILFVKGTVESEIKTETKHNLTMVNYMLSTALELAINQSKFVLSRSGYTTLMDLSKLGKKAFFIPTPGQYEQEYLAAYLEEQGVHPFCRQDQFSIEMLKRIEDYKGFQRFNSEPDFEQLFRLFKSE